MKQLPKLGQKSKKTVFVNAPLSTLAEGRLNAELRRLVEAMGYLTYLPQGHIPPGSDVSSLEVLNDNISAVRKSDIILTVLDKPGLGVAFELGYATARKKKIVALRTDPQDYLGKIIEGFWENLPLTSRATSLSELRAILRASRD